IGDDDVTCIDGHSVTNHWDVRARKTVMAYGRGGNNAQCVYGKTYFCEVRNVSDATIDDCAGKTTCGHRGAHQSAHAGDIDSVFHGHHVNGICAALIDSSQHSVQSVGIIVRVFFQLDSECEAGKFASKNWAHAMGHVHFATGKFLQGVGDGGDFHMAEAVEKGYGRVIDGILC